MTRACYGCDHIRAFKSGNRTLVPVQVVAKREYGLCQWNTRVIKWRKESQRG